MSEKVSKELALIRGALRQYVNVNENDIHEETTLQDLNIDSLTLAELMFEIEDKLETSVKEPEAPLKNIGDIICWIRPYLN
jgi:acyl carrier protein